MAQIMTANPTRKDHEMTNIIDRYLTDEVVEQAAQALRDHRSMECRALHEVGQPLRDTVYDNERRADARAALKATAPLIAAQALRDAADELRRLDDGRTGGYYEAGRHIIRRLDARADQIEAGR